MVRIPGRRVWSRKWAWFPVVGRTDGVWLGSSTRDIPPGDWKWESSLQPGLLQSVWNSSWRARWNEPNLRPPVPPSPARIEWTTRVCQVLMPCMTHAWRVKHSYTNYRIHVAWITQVYYVYNYTWYMHETCVTHAIRMLKTAPMWLG